MTLLPFIVSAELLKLQRLMVVRLSLVVAVVLGASGPFFTTLLVHGDYLWGMAPMADSLPQNVVEAFSWSLYLRHFFVTQAFVILVSAQLCAGEFQTNTIREVLLRSVSRPSFIIGKWVALTTWLVLLVLANLLGGVVAGVLLPYSGPWTDLLLALFVTVWSDSALAALVLFVSVLTRSTTLTIAGLFLFFVVDKLIGWGFFLVGSVLSTLPKEVIEAGYSGLAPAGELMLKVGPWLPSSGFEAYTGWTTEWSGPAFAVLTIILVGSIGGAILRFNTLDID